MQSTPTETPEPPATSDDLVAAAEAFQRVLEELVATQGRLVASLLLFLALFVGVFVLPVVVGRVRDAVGGILGGSRVAAGTQRASTYVPTSFAELLLRTAQLTVATSVVTAFLVVWGLVDVGTATGDLVDGTGSKLYRAALTLLFVAAAFVASDQLKQFITGVNRRLDSMTEHQEEILLRVGQVAIFVTTGASVLAVWRVNISGLLIGAGFLGIVVGFAARKTLGSLIAGFVLMFSRPFTIGDWVEIGDNHGIVTNITMFNTRLENFDGEFVVLPNDQVGDSSITNRSRKGLLRLRTDVGIDYDADVETASEVALDAMDAVDDVVSSPQPQVIPKAFGDSAIVLELRYWIDHPSPPRKWKAVSAVVTGVKTAFDEAGITIPYPQRTVSGREGAGLGVGRDEATDDGATTEGEAENGHAADSSIPDAGD